MATRTVGYIRVSTAHQAADGVHLEEDEEEQRALAVIDRLRASGMSIRAIAEALNDRAVPARGKRWHPTTIARLIKREAA